MLDHAVPHSSSLSRTRIDGFLLGLSNSCGPSPITDVIAAHLETGGSRVRALLAYEVCKRAGHSDASALAACGCVEALHQASLIHDDLTDRSPIRRSRPAVWAEHGDAVALAAGDHLISLAYACLAEASELELRRALPLVHRAVSATIKGQCADLSGNAARRTTAPAPQDDVFAAYSRVAALKSGPLLALGSELALTAEASDDASGKLRAACTNLAVGYQILDDCADVNEDRAFGQSSANLCLLLEAKKDLTPAEATETALLHGKQALRRAAHEATAIPGGLGIPTARLCMRKLRETEGMLDAV